MQMTTDIENEEQIVSDSFGMWIIALWGNISFQNPGLALQEYKTSFFMMLEKLLDEGKVRFVKPDADVYYNAKTNPNPRYTINDVESHWNVNTEEILSYLKDEWPSAAKDKDDLELNAYFYKIPAIIWRGEDGKWYGS